MSHLGAEGNCPAGAESPTDDVNRRTRKFPSDPSAQFYDLRGTTFRTRYDRLSPLSDGLMQPDGGDKQTQLERRSYGRDEPEPGMGTIPIRAAK